MDLCLPEEGVRREGGAFRDDLGPPDTMSAPERSTVICGLRDWRVPGSRRGTGASACTRPAPALVPYHAPAWLRAG